MGLLSVSPDAFHTPTKTKFKKLPVVHSSVFDLGFSHGGINRYAKSVELKVKQYDIHKAIRRLCTVWVFSKLSEGYHRHVTQVWVRMALKFLMRCICFQKVCNIEMVPCKFIFWLKVLHIQCYYKSSLNIWEMDEMHESYENQHTSYDRRIKNGSKVNRIWNCMSECPY